MARTIQIEPHICGLCIRLGCGMCKIEHCRFSLASGGFRREWAACAAAYAPSV